MAMSKILLDFETMTSEEYKINKELNMPIFIHDLWGILNKFKIQPSVVEITNLFISKDLRNKGLGSNILSQFVEKNEDNLILVVAGASVTDYDEEPTDNEIKRILRRLDMFYTKNDFINVNNIIGGYESKCCYVYNNMAYHVYLESLNSKEVGVKPLRVNDQSYLIDMFSENDNLKQKAMSIISDMKCPKEDKDDYHTILTYNCINDYWRLDTGSRDLLMKTLQDILKEAKI